MIFDRIRRPGTKTPGLTSPIVMQPNEVRISAPQPAGMRGDWIYPKDELVPISTLPDEVIDAIADRVAERVVERLSDDSA